MVPVSRWADGAQVGKIPVCEPVFFLFLSKLPVV